MTREIIICAHQRGFDGNVCECNLPASVNFSENDDANEFLGWLKEYVAEAIKRAQPQFKYSSDSAPMIDNIIWLPIVEE